MRYLVEPTRAEDLKKGDTVRTPSGNARVKRVTFIEEPHVVIHFQRDPHEKSLSRLYRQEEIVDKVVETVNEKTPAPREDAIKAVADELLSINRSVNSIVRIAADSGINLFEAND